MRPRRWLALALFLLGCTEDPDVFCDGDAVCALDCPDGACNFYCDGRARCEGACEGGECSLVCTGNASCALDCPSDDCVVFCQDQAECACTGCRLSCAEGARCE